MATINQDIQDPREIGTSGLRGVNSKWAKSAREFRQIANQINQNTLPIEGIGLQYKDIGFGDSIYDKNITFESQLNDLNELRAENQPWYSQITNGLAKGAVLAGTTFLDGTIGLLLGAGNAISEGRWSALWDNDFSKAMQSINEWSEQVMPNYYTRQEQEGPWYENIFTANFIGDKFLKNLGFTVGAFYSGGLEAGLIKGVGRAIAGAAKTAEAVKNITRATDMVASGVGSITSAVNEGRIEALNNSTDWYNSQKELINQAYESGQIDDAQYAEALAKANEDRLHMGNADLLMNLPILTASNLIQFGKMYANGMKTAKKGMNIIGNPGEWKSGSGKFLTTANAIKGALSEGVEEISQSAASRIAGNYYATDVNNFLRSKIDTAASQETLDWVKAFAQGINETVNDGSAWEEFFIGSLTGALGMPRARSFRNAEGKFQSPITIEGGIYNEIKESREKRIREQEVADYMNRRFNSPEFKNYYQGLIRHNKYQNDMNQAVENDDPFNFHNAEHAQLLSDIMMFDKAGKIQDLVEMVNGAFNTDDDNLESIARNTQVDGNGPFMDNGNPMYSTEEGKKKMISQLEENKNAILDTIESYRKAKEDINNDLPAGTRLSDDQMEELAWIKTQIDDWNKRSVSMSGNIKQVIGKVIGDIEGSIAAWTAIRDKEGMEHADLTETYRKYDDKINSYRRVLNELNAARSMSDEVLAETLSNGANKGFIDGIKGELKFIEDAILSKEEKDKVLKQLDDINKLANGKKYFAKKYIEYVTNPTKQLSDHKKAEDKAALAEETKDNLRKKDFIDNTDVSSLVRAANAGEIDLNDLDSLVKADADSDVKDERTEKIDKAIGIIDELNALQDRMLSVANDMGVDPSIVRDAEALLQKQQESIEDASQLADVESEVFNDLENLANSAEVTDEASLQQRMDTIKALVVNADQRLAADRDVLEGMPTEIPEDLANADETTPEVGHDSVTPAPAINGTSDSNSQDNVKPAFIQEALKDIKELMPNLDSTKAANAARKLGQVYEKLHSVFLSQGTISASFGNILAADTSFREVVDSLGEGNANTLLANRIKKYTNPQPQAQSDSPVTNPQPQNNNRLVTPDISDTNSVESQLNKENSRDSELPAHDSTSSFYNYWKPTLTEFYLHSNKELPRGQQMLAPEWADIALKQGKITLQQARRIKVVHAFLLKHNAFTSVNNGEVTINTKDATKDKPRVHFITSKELNTEAGEVVILIVSDQGRIIGDLGSKNDRNTHKQVGLLDFIAKAEQEYYKKKDSNADDLVPLSGSTSVLQNLIGSPKYTETGNRRTLNEIWEGKEFKLAVAASSGQNADMLMSGRSLKAGKTDDEKMILSPLDSKAGQPYVLVTTSSMMNFRHYYPVPFTMPKFSSETKNSSLGRAIQAIIKAGIESKNWEIIKGNAAKGYPGIPELLGVDKVSVSFKDNGNIKLGIQVKGTWHNLEVSLDNPNVVNTVVDGIANIGIPFQISRKYLNGTYGPTGQSYNQMIGELAQTNLPVGVTHTVMDWFTLNPIGTDGKEQRGTLMRPTGVNPGTVARESRQGEIEVSVNGFTYYVDLAGNKVRSATGEFTGTLADTCIAKARCIKQGWDGVSHQIYQCGIGWFDPVLNKWVPKPADAQEPTTTIETPSVSQTTADNSNLDSAIAAMADIDEIATSNSTTATPILIEGDLERSKDSVDAVPGEVYFSSSTDSQGFTTIKLGNGVISKTGKNKMVTVGGVKTVLSIKDVLSDEDYDIFFTEHPGLNSEEDWRISKIIIGPDGRVGGTIWIKMNGGGYQSYDVSLKINPFNYLSTEQLSQKQKERVQSSVAQQPSTSQTRQQEEQSTEQKISQVRANLIGEQEEIFDAMTPEQQAKLANFPNEAMINTALERINTEIWDDGEFSGNVDDYLNTRFSLEDSRKYGRKWNERKEMAWLRKALPQLSSVEIARTHNGLIKVGNSTYAYGMFKNGIITIAEAAARGTLYHEAFHAVTWTLFTDAERKELFDEAKKQYGITNDLETEERLAEDFRRYVQIEETPVIGKVVRFFRRLKHMIMGLFGNEQYLDKVFYSINRGLYAGRQVNTTDTTRLNKYTAEEEEILRNAPRDSEGRLLAPNGKPSNLTERQYVQVRTKAFKDWFGDWEKVANFARSNAYEELEKYASDNGMHSRLIRFLMDNFNPNIRALVSRLGSGLYNPLYKELHIPLYQYGIEDGPAAMKGNKKIVLHELVHSITTSLLYSYYNIKQPGYEQTLREQGYKDELPILSKEQVEAFDKIREIQKKVSKYIEEHKKEVEDTQRKYDVHFDYQTFITYYRGTENDKVGYLDEFISEAFSNPALQEIMSKIASEEEAKKTIFDVFLEALGKLFNFKGTLLHDFFNAAQDALDSSYNNASKVVDENGEPLVVYHGATFSNDIKIFNSQTSYFTENKVEADKYGDKFRHPQDNSPKSIPVFLNIRNPHILDAEGREYSNINNGVFVTFDEFLKSHPKYQNESWYWKYQVGEEGLNIPKNVMDAYHKVSTSKTVRTYVSENIGKNNDGIIVKNVLDPADGNTSKTVPITDYVPNSSNQIKSATDNIGTFDPNNPDIRYSLVNDIQELEHLVDQAERERATMSAAWNKARNIAHKGKLSREGKTVYYSIGGEFNNPIEAKEYINRNIPKNIRDFFYVKDYMGSTYIYYTEVNANRVYNKYSDAKEEAVRALSRVKNNRDAILSEEALEEQAEYEQRIEQYHREKLEYGNLTDEQKEYLEMRKLSREEYNRMTDFEREVLFHCMGI